MVSSRIYIFLPLGKLLLMQNSWFPFWRRDLLSTLDRAEEALLLDGKGTGPPMGRRTEPVSEAQDEDGDHILRGGKWICQTACSGIGFAESWEVNKEQSGLCVHDKFHAILWVFFIVKSL